MNRKKLYRMKFLLLSSVFFLNSMTVKGEEKNAKTNYGKKLYDWCYDVDQSIHDKVLNPLEDKMDELELFKKESLWLITDEPQVDSKRGRHYFFVDENTPSIKKTSYYNDEHEKIKGKDGRFEEKKEMYVSLEDIDEVFLMKTILDHETNTFSKNYVDFDDKNTYTKDEKIKYGRYTNIEDILPESMIEEKYSKKDLEAILSFLEEDLKENLKRKKELK